MIDDFHIVDYSRVGHLCQFSTSGSFIFNYSQVMLVDYSLASRPPHPAFVTSSTKSKHTQLLLLAFRTASDKSWA